MIFLPADPATTAPEGAPRPRPTNESARPDGAAPRAEPDAALRQRPAGETGGHTVQEWEQPAAGSFRPAAATASATKPQDSAALADAEPVVPIVLRPTATRGEARPGEAMARDSTSSSLAAQEARDSGNNSSRPALEPAAEARFADAVVRRLSAVLARAFGELAATPAQEHRSAELPIDAAAKAATGEGPTRDVEAGPRASASAKPTPSAPDANDAASKRAGDAKSVVPAAPGVKA